MATFGGDVFTLHHSATSGKLPPGNFRLSGDVFPPLSLL